MAQGWVFLPSAKDERNRLKTWCSHDDRPVARSTGYRGDTFAEEGAIWVCKCGDVFEVAAVGGCAPSESESDCRKRSITWRRINEDVTQE